MIKVDDGDYDEAQKSWSLFEKLGAHTDNTLWVIKSLVDTQKARNISPLVVHNFVHVRFLGYWHFWNAFPSVTRCFPSIIFEYFGLKSEDY